MAIGTELSELALKIMKKLPTIINRINTNIKIDYRLNNNYLASFILPVLGPIKFKPNKFRLNL